MNKERVILIGAGRVGISLSVALKRRGYPLLGVIGRKKEALESACNYLGAPALDGLHTAVFGSADVVLITTSDDAIGEVAGKVRTLYPSLLLVHTSGLHPSTILGDGPRLAMHPLQSFASVKEALENLAGSVFSLEGDTDGIQWGKKVVGEIGGRWVLLSLGQKPLYHLSACIASNFLVTLFYFALKGMESAGIEKELAHEGLLSLVKGTLRNIERLGVPKALTGPIARGDRGTIRSHLDALEANKKMKEFYINLALYTIRMLKHENPRDSLEVLREMEKMLLQHRE